MGRHAYDHHPTPQNPMVRWYEDMNKAMFVRDNGTDNMEVTGTDQRRSGTPVTARHNLWSDGDYDEFKRRLDTGQLVVFENGRWWRRGFNYATLIDDDKPFRVSIDGQWHDYTHAFEPPRHV